MTESSVLVGGEELPCVVSVVGVDVTHRGAGNDPNVCCGVNNPIHDVPECVRCVVYSVGMCAHAITNAAACDEETDWVSVSACLVVSCGVDVPTT